MCADEGGGLGSTCNPCFDAGGGQCVRGPAEVQRGPACRSAPLYLRAARLTGRPCRRWLRGPWSACAVVRTACTRCSAHGCRGRKAEGGGLPWCWVAGVSPSTYTDRKHAQHWVWPWGLPSVDRRAYAGSRAAMAQRAAGRLTTPRRRDESGWADAGEPAGGGALLRTYGVPNFPLSDAERPLGRQTADLGSIHTSRSGAMAAQVAHTRAHVTERARAPMAGMGRTVRSRRASRGPRGFIRACHLIVPLDMLVPERFHELRRFPKKRRACHAMGPAASLQACNTARAPPPGRPVFGRQKARTM